MFTGLTDDELDQLWEMLMDGAQKMRVVYPNGSGGMFLDTCVVLVDVENELDSRV